MGLLFLVQSLAEWAQAQIDLLREVANEHTRAAAAHEAKLQDEIAITQEIQRVKEVMARQAQKEAVELKKKLENAEQKAKDATANLRAMTEGKPSTLPWTDSAYLARSWCLVFDLESLQALEGPSRPSRRSWSRSRAN
jgi:hypothetical protein